MTHPLIRSIQPLVEAIGGTIVPPAKANGSDIGLHWQGKLVAAVRLPNLSGALERQVAIVEAEIGGKLKELDRDQKRLALHMLEERGAFTLRKGVEQVADLMGISRFTVYSYLNAVRPDGGYDPK